MWLLLAGVVICPSPQRERLAPLWVALLWGYCLLDHVDGCRARRRRSSSAWGEFLDHALDAWHGAIAVYAIGAMGGHVVHPAVLAGTIATVGLATVATWLEQKLRGTFTLGAFGPVEAVLAAGIYLALWSWPEAARVLSSPVSETIGLTWANLALFCGASGNLLTVAAVAGRTRAVVAPLAAAGFVSIAILGLGFGSGLGWATLGVAVAILAAEYSARVIASHLTDSAMPWPDAVGPVLLAVGAVLPPDYRPLAGAGLVWLGGRAIMTWRSARQRIAGEPAPGRATLALELDLD